MRDVSEIAAQALHDRPEFKIALGGPVAFEQGDGMKVGWQRADFSYFFRRANEEILILAVKPAQRPHHISRVGTNAELRHATDVDGNLHRSI